MPLTDYKAKYLDLKAKYQETVDLAWRLGFEQGLKEAQLDQAQQATAQSEAMAANQPGQPGEESAQPGEESEAESPVSQNPNGDELDQHIAKLEGMLGKSEISSMDMQDLKKTLSDIRSLQVQISLTKSMNSIKTTKLAKSQAISFSPKVEANLPAPAKKALSLQEKIVGDIFSKWEKDEKKASNDIMSILSSSNTLKDDKDGK